MTPESGLSGIQSRCSCVPNQAPRKDVCEREIPSSRGKETRRRRGGRRRRRRPAAAPGTASSLPRESGRRGEILAWAKLVAGLMGLCGPSRPLEPVDRPTRPCARGIDRLLPGNAASSAAVASRRSPHRRRRLASTVPGRPAASAAYSTPCAQFNLPSPSPPR
mgnify:CR=1 FL=1